jgi:elongation factor P
VIGANELKRKLMILVEGQPYLVEEVFFASPSARGASTMVRTKLRNLLTGSASEKTFKASEKFDEADVEKLSVSFLYRDDQGYCFMDQASYEQFYLDEKTIADARQYLKEECVLQALKYNEKIASIQLPPYVNLKVTSTEPSIKGASSSGSGNKQAVLETGLTVRVPLYIEEGDIVRVNTETGECGGRASAD